MSEKFPGDRFINVTDISLTTLISKAYEMSEPLGLGYFHYVPGPLDAATVGELVDTMSKQLLESKVTRFDYLHGRSMKFTVWQGNDGQRYIRRQWYDHSAEAAEHLVYLCKQAMEVGNG